VEGVRVNVDDIICREVELIIFLGLQSSYCVVFRGAVINTFVKLCIVRRVNVLCCICTRWGEVAVVLIIIAQSMEVWL
jgi:hypothetical protein